MAPSAVFSIGKAKKTVARSILLLILSEKIPNPALCKILKSCWLECAGNLVPGTGAFLSSVAIAFLAGIPAKSAIALLINLFWLVVSGATVMKEDSAIAGAIDKTIKILSRAVGAALRLF